MSLKCSCGCGQDLPASESKINEWGFLETMRRECIDIGRGSNSDLERVWDKFVSGLDEESLSSLGDGRFRV